MILITCTTAAISDDFDRYRDFMIENNRALSHFVARKYNYSPTDTVLITQVIGRLDARMCNNTPEGLFFKLDVPENVVKRLDADQLADHMHQYFRMRNIPFTLFIPINGQNGRVVSARR